MLVEREMGRDQDQHATGLQGIDRFGEEVIVQGEFLTVVVHLEIGERDVADHGVDAGFGQLRVSETFAADVLLRMNRFGYAAGEGVEFDADEVLPRFPVAQEVADAAARFEDCGLIRKSQAADRFVDAVDDRGQGVERIERGAFGAAIDRLSG